MELKAYAKVNLILNVLGERPDGYHEVKTLMQAIPLHDVVTVRAESAVMTSAGFEYKEKDLAYKAAVLMAESFMPKKAEEDGVRGVSIRVEKHIPAAAGLAGGSADAAAVLIGLARLWEIASPVDDEALLNTLHPLAAKLGSDVPFCLAAQLGRPAAIASGTGTQLEFVEPADFNVRLYFSDINIPDKTKAVYAELKEEDCRPVFDIRAFLSAKSLDEKRSLMGNHLQAPAERLMQCMLCAAGAGAQGIKAFKAARGIPEGAMLCGAGPTYFTIE